MPTAIMSFRGRALFNLLYFRYRGKELPTSLEEWQIEDYRDLSNQEIFSRLQTLDIHLDEEAYLLFASSCESPEQLLYYVAPKEIQTLEKQKIYLLLFELWRRLLPKKQSLSIFCDELDHIIDAYHKDNLEEEKAQEYFIHLENILDQSVDEGNDSHTVFTAFSRYLAHDLELFLYGYINDLIDAQKCTYASELVDGFYQYFSSTMRFDLLRVRLMAETDIEEANIMAQRLLQRVVEDKSKLIAFDLLSFLAKNGKSEVFYQAYQEVVPFIQTESDFKKMLHIAADYYRGFDKELEEKTIQKILEERQEIDPDRKIEIKDLILKIFNPPTDSQLSQ